MDKRNATQILKFCVMGTCNAAITYVSLLAFSLMGIEVGVANAVGYALVLINSFVCSKLWVFKSDKKKEKHIFRELFLFIIIFLTAYFFQFLTFYCSVHLLGINKYWANLLGLFVFGGINFVANKYFTFK